MRLELARRLAVIMLSAALAIGPMAHANQSEPYHGQVTSAAAMAGDHLTTGVPAGCVGDQNVNVQVTCFANCVSVGSLPPLAIIFGAVAPGDLGLPVDLAMIDHAIPPDPYPPKSPG